MSNSRKIMNQILQQKEKVTLEQIGNYLDARVEEWLKVEPIEADETMSSEEILCSRYAEEAQIYIENYIPGYELLKDYLDSLG